MILLLPGYMPVLVRSSTVTRDNTRKERQEVTSQFEDSKDTPISLY
jgi:hypothetical protein